MSLHEPATSDQMSRQHVLLQELPPHLRLLAWPALRGRDSVPCDVVVPDRYRGLPTPLLAQADGVALHVPDEPAHADAELLALLTSGAATPALRPLLDIVVCMALWDEALRTRGVFAGNAYLASEDAVGSLLRVADVEIHGSLVDHIQELQSFELLYRFPIAYKFRGAYGVERQCRLNGWGRLLYRHLDEAGGAGLPVATWRTAIDRHLQVHHESYRTALDRATHAVDEAPGQTWGAARALPVPVLM
ncbi:hypothetical protein [Streptomyces sp. MI02-7b]|uniref:hypothetical protein n=1 Tax=Streptomyces sp. MI02-7b TaxID=462941 RepID=UPI0029B21B33|nr:hypothetical protein [Streptomyces sp. MI02-7b]MDX3075923.1 hypothetical protein [Streptomyces sp. MI02-7b]